MITPYRFYARVGPRVLYVQYNVTKWFDRRCLRAHAYSVGSVSTPDFVIELTHDEKMFVEQLIGEHLRTGKVPAKFAAEVT